ncbi:MAG: hypothetical protein GSR86_05210 [Desulfurococcales archaeon]|nr:hypothetical protein [Desulfurococcales archaeon]
MRRKRGEPIFTSRAWLVSIRVGGEHREYCIDSGLAPFLTRGFRRILLIYPSNICEHTASSTRLLDGPGMPALLDSIVEGCRGAEKLVEELAGKAKPRPRSLATFRRATQEEVLYTEARNALLLCQHVFGEDLNFALEWFKPSYINYSRSKNILWKRLKSLSRIEESISELVESL